MACTCALCQISQAMRVALWVGGWLEPPSLTPSVSSSTCSINRVNESRSNSWAAASVPDIPATLRAGGRAVTDRFDAGADGVAHERTEVTGVIFRPQPRGMQRLGTQPHRGVVEGTDRAFVGGLEGEMDFPVWSHGGAVGDPERRLAVPPVADGPAEIH